MTSYRRQAKLIGAIVIGICGVAIFAAFDDRSDTPEELPLVPMAAVAASSGPTDEELAEIKQLEAQVRKVPASNLDENVRLYGELLDLDPDNPHFRAKYSYYLEKKMNVEYQAAPRSFGSFSGEAEKATIALSCPNPKITGASGGYRKLYGCILGGAETVKWFINEDAASGGVLNVKLMWNDWTSDIGYGLHADRADAQRALNLLVTLYAPNLSSEIQAAFWGAQDSKFTDGSLVISVKVSPGPKITERLVVVSAIN